MPEDLNELENWNVSLDNLSKSTNLDDNSQWSVIWQINNTNGFDENPEWPVVWEINDTNDFGVSSQWSVIWEINDTNDFGVNPQWSVIWQINDTDYQENHEEHKSPTRSISKKVKLVWRLACLIVLCIIIWVACSKYDRYVRNYAAWIEVVDIKIVNYYEQVKWTIYKMLGKDYSRHADTIRLDNEQWKTNLHELIENRSITYIQKKEALKESLNDFYNIITRNAEKLEEIKKHVSAYWFFSDKLSNIISSDEQITSIQDFLTAIRAIKFSSAISVFSNLDTFVDSLAKETGKSKETVLENMQMIQSRWEKDINLYIKNCELNAFEVDYECDNIWDFDKYYSLVWDKEFDTEFFKYLMNFIKDKLEQTEIPSFSIKFKWFNQQSNELSFDIVINIQKADKVELAKKWILSPHSFILNSLINNLKLSRAIISEWIEVKSIDVQERVITVWMTEFAVETAQKSFTVPIKNENQIEIDDFKY